jgi:uncharacterized MAPEG superfamily protein
MSLNTGYFSLVASSIAICASKLTVVHLLTVRERLLSNNLVQKSDDAVLRPIRSLLTVLSGCYGPSLGGAAFISRCERIGKNIAENEPMFFLLAIGYGLMVHSADKDTTVATTTSSAKALVQVYTAARVAHTIVYLTDVGSAVALRAMCYVTGLVSGVALVGLTFKARTK